jgi:hypothetical protein
MKEQREERERENRERGERERGERERPLQYRRVHRTVSDHQGDARP